MPTGYQILGTILIVILLVYMYGKYNRWQLQQRLNALDLRALLSGTFNKVHIKILMSKLPFATMNNVLAQLFKLQAPLTALRLEYQDVQYQVDQTFGILGTSVLSDRITKVELAFATMNQELVDIAKLATVA
jgi:hypothetical protein